MLPRGIATLRAARASEAAAIARLSRRHVEQGLRWRWTPSRVRRSIADSETMVLVAAVGETVAGFAIMRFGDLDAHLHLLAVAPEHRRAGLGTDLLRWLERCCRTAGLRHVRLEVRAGNRAARRFYETVDFRLIGRISGYYDRREAALVYEKSLY